MTPVIKAEFRAERPLPLLRTLPAPEAFPVEALGDVLGPAAEAIQERRAGALGNVQSGRFGCCSARGAGLRGRRAADRTGQADLQLLSDGCRIG